VSGFLHRLVARTIGQANVVRPRPVPRFAGTLDPPVDSPYAAPSDASAVERFDDKTILPGRTYTEGEPAGDNLPAAVQRPPGPMLVEQSSRAAFLDERDADDVSTSEELRVDFEGIAPHDNVPIGADEARAPGTPPSLSARENAAQSFRAANQIAGRDSSADSAPAANVPGPPARTDEPRIADTARTHGPRMFDADDRVDVAMLGELADPSPLAPTLAGPRTGVRQSEAIGSGSPNYARGDAPSEPEATIVNVMIGRIEVRPPAEPATRTIRREAPAAPQPRDQLDAYLRARGGSRR
jgi:hypothetical protein